MFGLKKATAFTVFYLILNSSNWADRNQKGIYKIYMDKSSSILPKSLQWYGPQKYKFSQMVYTRFGYLKTGDLIGNSQ